MLLRIRPGYEISASMSRIPFASFDPGLFFYSAAWPSILPRLALVLTRCQEDSGPAGDPVDICCLLHMWLDSQMGEGNPRRWHAQFRWRLTWRNGSGNS